MGGQEEGAEAEAGDGQPRVPAGRHPPAQLNSLFWTSATLRPRRLVGPEHWVKSPMVGRCLSHCESQARWQSQNRWLECRRLQGDRAAHNPSPSAGPPPPQRGGALCSTQPMRISPQACSSNPGTVRPSPPSMLGARPRLDIAQPLQTHRPELIRTHHPKSHNSFSNTKRNHLFSKEKSNMNNIQHPFI